MAANKFVKNRKRSFGSIMRAKHSEVIMTKLCPRGKADAAKRKFKVYPSA